VSIQAGANANTNYASSPLMPVATSQTSADGVAVALIQFPDTDAVASRDAIVTAVLQVYLGGIDGAPLSHDQVLTLVSNPYSWDLQTVTWNTMPLVKAPPADGVKTTTDNFIKFGVNTADPDAMPMGMPVVPVVLPDGGMYLRVDVTEYIKRSKTLNYAIVRMFRYDASTAGPGDDPQGVYNFGSGAVGDAAKVPSLLLDYQTG